MSDPAEHYLVRRFVDDLTDHAIVMLDSRGTILTWNAGARALLGYAPEEIVGRNFSELYTKLDLMNDRSNASLKDALHWGRHEASGVLIAKDGSKQRAQVVLRPLSDAGQKLAGFGMMVQVPAEAVQRRASAKPEPAVDKKDAVRGSIKILVVDDNQGVLEETLEMLSSLGYSVVSASNGKDALAVLEANKDVDLLFTDVVMPGQIAAGDLASQARQMCPGLKVLFASGYFEGALVSKGDLETDVRFIAKPYRKKELVVKIDEVLNASA